MKKIILVFVVLSTLLCLVSCGGKLDWPDGKLGNLIPQIEGAKGKVGYENLDSLYITLDDISESQYLDYIEMCKNKGFSAEILEEDDSFVAFNDKGYKIDISYFSSEDMWITVDAPVSMSDFDWPNSDIAKLLPEPDSNYGKIEREAEHIFAIYVGNTTKSEYKNYVDAVYESGFTVDYNKGDDYFYADNADGYSVSVKYEGFNTMFVRIDEPDEETPEDNEEAANKPVTTTKKQETTTKTPVTTSKSANSISPEFKAAMDSYEAFFGEYCAFMKKYKESTNPLGMMNDYLDFMSRYTDAMNKLNEIGDEDLNEAELLYYTEVMLRINQKILEAAQ